MSEWQQRVRVMAGRFGIPGSLAVLLLAGAAWMQWVAVPAADLAGLELRRLASDEGRRARMPQGPDASPPQLLARAVAGLADETRSNATLATLLQRGEARGLQVDAVQFQTEETRLGGVRRHRASLPLVGRYADLRAWISDTLRDNPSVTVDSLELRRKDAGTELLQARVSLSLWTVTVAPAQLAAREDGHGG
jgi:hypothetical protein